MSNKILGDHTRKGKVLKPPVLSLGIFTETSWIELQVPELIWIGLLVKKFGPEKGTSIATDMAKIAEPFITPKIIKSPLAPMIISSYSLLDENEKNLIKSHLQIIKILKSIQSTFTDFWTFYPTSPISFLKDETEEMLIPADLDTYKAVLGELLDRVSYDSTIVLAAACNFLLMSDRLVLTKNIDLPPLSEILNYPETENSQRLASFLRSAIKPYFREGYDTNNSWANYFWNQNYSLEPCTI